MWRWLWAGWSLVRAADNLVCGAFCSAAIPARPGQLGACGIAKDLQAGWGNAVPVAPCPFSCWANCAILFVCVSNHVLRALFPPTDLGSGFLEAWVIPFDAVCKGTHPET